MSTRGIIARTDERGWLGVFHNYDSRAQDLGNELLKEITAQAGDLEAFTRALIDDSPHPWGWWPSRSRSEAEQHLLRPEDLADAVQAWVEWFYLFDVQARTLEVWEGGLPKDGGTLLHTVHFDADGASVPAVFSAPGLPWWDIPEVEGWEVDGERSARHRSRFAWTMAQWCAAQGVAEDAARAKVGQWLDRAIDELEWAPPDARSTASERERCEQLGIDPEPEYAALLEPGEPLRLSGWWSGSSRMWRLELPKRTLLYRSGGDLRQAHDALHAWRPDRTHARFDLLDALTEVAPLPDRPLLRALRNAGQAALATGTLTLIEDQLWKRVVVTQHERSETEIPLEFANRHDPDAEVGDVLFLSLPEAIVDPTVLDWLRMGQVPHPPNWTSTPIPMGDFDVEPIREIGLGIWLVAWGSVWPGAVLTHWLHLEYPRLAVLAVMALPGIAVFVDSRRTEALAAWLAVGALCIGIVVGQGLDPQAFGLWSILAFAAGVAWAARFLYLARGAG